MLVSYRVIKNIIILVASIIYIYAFCVFIIKIEIEFNHVPNILSSLHKGAGTVHYSFCYLAFKAAKDLASQGRQVDGVDGQGLQVKGFGGLPQHIEGLDLQDLQEKGHASQGAGGLIRSYGIQSHDTL